MDIFTPFRLIFNNISGLYNYFTINDKNTNRQPRLFIDISEVHIHDNGTGVPRVTNGIRNHLSKFDLPYEVVEVYAKPHNQGFFAVSTNKPIKVSKNDFFFGLDFSKFLIPQNKRHIFKFRRIGMPVFFFLHDLILLFPTSYRNHADEIFKKWIDVIKQCDGFIANSKSTQDEMLAWLKKQPKKSYNNQIKYGYIHLGTSFSPKNFIPTINKTNKHQFLAVGTVGARKRYDQIVAAFDILWKNGYDVSLQIVGKPGGKENAAVFNQIHNNSQYGKNLIWHENFITDEQLGNLYGDSVALIFASELEGFGLPLIEAATYGKPIIARDIPIFREVTNNEAFFFKGNEPNDLATAIKDWIYLYQQGKITSPKIKLYSWEESTKETIDILFGNKTPKFQA